MFNNKKNNKDVEKIDTKSPLLEEVKSLAPSNVLAVLEVLVRKIEELENKVK